METAWAQSEVYLSEKPMLGSLFLLNQIVDLKTKDLALVETRLNVRKRPRSPAQPEMEEARQPKRVMFEEEKDFRSEVLQSELNSLRTQQDEQERRVKQLRTEGEEKEETIKSLLARI